MSGVRTSISLFEMIFLQNPASTFFRIMLSPIQREKPAVRPNSAVSLVPTKVDRLEVIRAK